MKASKSLFAAAMSASMLFAGLAPAIADAQTYRFGEGDAHVSGADRAHRPPPPKHRKHAPRRHHPLPR